MLLPSSQHGRKNTKSQFSQFCPVINKIHAHMIFYSVEPVTDTVHSEILVLLALQIRWCFLLLGCYEWGEKNFSEQQCYKHMSPGEDRSRRNMETMENYPYVPACLCK